MKEKAVKNPMSFTILLNNSWCIKKYKAPHLLKSWLIRIFCYLILKSFLTDRELFLLSGERVSVLLCV